MTAFLFFLGGWAIRSSLVTLAGIAICTLARRMSGAQQNLIWRTCLWASMIIGLWMIGGPKIPVPIPAIDLQDQVPNSTFVQASSMRVLPNTREHETLGDYPAPRAGAAITRVSPAQDVRWETLIGIFYLLGAGIVMIRWLHSIAVVHRLCKMGQPFDGSQTTLVSDAPTVGIPFAYGWPRPVIILPSDAYAWSAERLEAVLLHERSHLSRNDWIWQSATTVHTALQWFNPAAWFLSARVRSTAEVAADDEVLQSGILPSAYAKHLMSFAIQSEPLRDAALGIARHRGVPDRIARIVSPCVNRNCIDGRMLFLAGLSFSTMGVSLAALTPASEKAPWAPIHLSGSSNSGPMMAKLPNGSVLQIKYIGPGTSNLLPTWKPDGSPNNERPKEFHSTYSNRADQSVTRSVAIGCDLTDLPLAEQNILGRVSSVFDCTLGGVRYAGHTTGGGNREFHTVRFFQIPSKWQEADLKVGVGVGKFRKLLESRNGAGNLSVKVIPNPQAVHMSTTGADGKIAESKTKQNYSDITMELPSQFDTKQWRLLIYDVKGKELQSMITYADRATPLKDDKKITWHATCFAAPEEIDRYVIEGRNLQWARFKNIQLYPQPSK